MAYDPRLGRAGIPESVQSLLDEQERQAERFRALTEAPLTSRFSDFIADRLSQADHAMSLLERVQDGHVRKILGNEDPRLSPAYEKIVGIYPSLTRGVVAVDESSRRESSGLHKKLSDLEGQLTQLRSDIADKSKAIQELAAGSSEKDEAILELEQKVAQLSEAQRLAHLLARVEPAAQRKLLESSDFRAEFDRDAPCDAFVLSIDIRRSTELMLKARNAKLFAQFLLGLTRTLRDVVLLNHGVFDKFTGDGILAFFPSFYSGPDAGLLALRTAEQAHVAFLTHYDAHRHCFVTVRRDVGLGIGIDFGSVQIVQIESEFTVVGTPVVYACRMAGAEPGQTLVNQPAFEQLSDRYSVACDFAALDLEIKHEGRTLAYAVRLNGRPYSVAAPTWHCSDEPSA